ncbi:CMK2_4 [Sanghuangporus sanghuang]
MSHSGTGVGMRPLPYDIHRKIGSGHFGRVYEGRNPRTNQRVALKIFKEETGESLIRLELRNNKKVRSFGRHPNIINFLGDYVYGHEKCPVFVFEYAGGGNVFTRLRSMGSFSEADTRDILRGVFKGLKHLHKHRIMHRDIKPENILLKTNTLPHEPALSDFGVSGRLNPGWVPEYFKAGTMPYNPPEAFKYGLVGRKGDVWAVGVVMHELLVGERPFAGSPEDDNERLIKEILTKRIDFRSDYYKDVSLDGRDLMKKLLTKNPNLRPTVEDTIEHPWFTSAPGEKSFTPSKFGRRKCGRPRAAMIRIRAALSHINKSFRSRRHESSRNARKRRGRTARTRGKRADWRRTPVHKVGVKMPDREAVKRREPSVHRSHRSRRSHRS